MDDDWYYDATRDEMYRLREIMDRVSDWADFFGKIGTTLTWLAALEVGLGVVYCWDVGRSARTIVQWVAYLFVFVEIVFTFVILGFWEHFYTLLFRYYRDFYDLSYPDVEPLYRLYKVQATYSILLGVAATALLGFAIALVVKARRHTSQRQVRYKRAWFTPGEPSYFQVHCPCEEDLLLILSISRLLFSFSSPASSSGSRRCGTWRLPSYTISSGSTLTHTPL